MPALRHIKWIINALCFQSILFCFSVIHHLPSRYAHPTMSRMSSAAVSEYGEKEQVWASQDTDIERANQPAIRYPSTRSQPPLPPSPTTRKIANASPLGLLAFATSTTPLSSSLLFSPLPPTHTLTYPPGMFLMSAYGVHARAISTPNLLLGVLIFFGGICQFIAGLVDLCTGNTFGATVFPSYGAFNFAYAFIYIPSSGILKAYTDKGTGVLVPEFEQALAVWIWAWFILTGIFAVGAMRSNAVLVSTLVVLCVDLACQATGLMVGEAKLLMVGNGLGFIVCFLACEYFGFAVRCAC